MGKRSADGNINHKARRIRNRESSQPPRKLSRLLRRNSRRNQRRRPKSRDSPRRIFGNHDNRSRSQKLSSPRRDAIHSTQIKKSMTIDNDLEKIALQEKRLQFKSFDAETAWAIGTALITAADKRGAKVAIDIQLH